MLMDDLKKIVKESTEDEVKSLLYLIFLRIQMVEETKQDLDEQLVKDLKKIYHDFLNYKRNQLPNVQNQSYKVVNLVFGDSPSGSLKIGLKEMGLQNEEDVISFSDLFSIGPVWQLHEANGLNHRFEWLKNHIIFDDEYIDSYQDHFRHTTSQINAIPENTPIVIWIGENAHEQTGLRYVLYLLKEKSNDIFLMNTTTKYKNLFPVPDAEIFPLHTGEISPEKFRLIYEKSKEVYPLTQEERHHFEDEWEKLSTKQEVLRVWGKNEISSVNEDYFDDYIIHSARRLQRRDAKFMKSARLVGEVIGHLQQYIGDGFVEYRVRHLIMNGIFEIKGIPKAMRYYSVKLKNTKD
ncbi:DUF1835 domain-containing protein [Ammoniphilus resinae]|uniref:DUF1835 domain-containing protein n=1 Tax=Ammoniphilus resinae TaxID=861532 RepID=A0ABS4GSH7_9BACL|nr:DUF1835 domain-containing protein [Ammoniphilus resinae]MBP1933206.1 hypothetical protein [Ammoniphilus resinae]